MSLHTLPKLQPPESITTSLSKGIYHFVLDTILQEAPDQSQPEQFAEALIAIAKQYDVPVENIRNWLHYKQPGKEFTIQSFERWAQAYQDLVAQVLKAQKTRFCECGYPLQMLGESLFCADCGERV
jgi:hypothetical protein